jgi:outer membrane protein assembly factor BamD
MAYKLRLAVVFLLIGAGLPCFSRPPNRGMRNRNRASQMGKMPLESLLAEAQNVEAQGNTRLADRLYKIICKVYRGRVEASNAYFARGVIYKKNHQFLLAIKMFRKIIERYPESPLFSQAVEHCFQIAEELREGVRPRYFGVVPGFRDFDSAIKAYELIVKCAPFSRFTPESLKQIAELQTLAKHYDLAIDALGRIIDLYSNSVETAYAYLKIAEIYESLGKGEEYNQGGAVTARRYYLNFITTFPQHPKVSFAKERIRKLEESIVESKIALGDFYFNVRYNEKAAKKSYRSAIDFAPYVPAAGLAQLKIAEIDGGKKPRSTPIDFLFPPYKLQSNDEFVASAMVQDRIMDQKDGRVDPVNEKSVTPFVKSEDVLVPDKVDEA